MDRRTVVILRPIVTLLLFLILFVVTNYSDKLKLIDQIDSVTSSLGLSNESKFGCDIQYPTISLNGSVDTDMYVCLRKALDGAPADARLVVILNSTGGYVHIQNKIVDLINVDGRVKSMVCIQCYSSAAFIFELSQVRRLMFEDSKLMFHKIYFSDSPTSKPSEKDYLRLDEDNLVIAIRISQRIDMDKKDYIEKTKDDWYISGNEALKLKMVDKILKL